MSLCKAFGKDKVIFATAEDHATPSTVQLPESEPQPGLILDNGDINWNCPCLGGMATGPCGVEFREAFSCFHYSEAAPKGSDCYDAFKTMQDCMGNYPGVYAKQNQRDGDDDDEDDGLDLGAAMAGAEQESPDKVSVDSVDATDAGSSAAVVQKSV
ncbi:mitochondrial intermembrane space import and assembly protein 40 [Culex quinquefasciatus]|uniref:Mitochondrial intermembrane space import and assembly protein 40 n=1 Tax=Culex quinquefasciatus TaxID=7176 RepID=B0X6P5_CULQU|nr:mitochondrial intermembrane space import and assembly protein 40 [Culex quinquefasciatus]|eukprot:XP_001865317.1 mitochondrial intermembrane space import and assembly protein 40 [Culex quinquefasciatus]